MTKNAFYVTLKALAFFRYLNFCPNVFCQVGKRLEQKTKFNFKIYDVMKWQTNNYNTHIA